MYRGASNFLSETPEIYEIAIEKPQLIPNGPFPAAEPREKVWSRRNNPSRATHGLTESKLNLSHNILVIHFPLPVIDEIT